MQIAPLIHSRTLHCDFNPNFAVRPKDLDVNWAMKKILKSTLDIDILNGERLLTAYQGNVGIAGIACKFKSFIEKYVPEELDAAQKYFHDERGREIKIFIGYVFRGNGVPDVSYKDFWQMFKENLVPQWEFKTSETKFVDYQNCNTKTVGSKISPAENIGGVEFHITGNDEKLFAQCINNHKNFCSNVDQFKIISSGEFNVIATSQNNIDRYKSESAQKKNQSATQAQSASASRKNPHGVNQSTHSTTSSPGNSTGLIVGGAAVLILAAIIYLLT